MDIGEQRQRLTDRLDALEAENRHLRSVVQHQHDEVDAAEALDAPMSRRNWLARGAAVAVGAVAGGVCLSRGCGNLIIVYRCRRGIVDHARPCSRLALDHDFSANRVNLQFSVIAATTQCDERQEYAIN